MIAIVSYYILGVKLISLVTTLDILILSNQLNFKVSILSLSNFHLGVQINFLGNITLLGIITLISS